MVRHCSKLPRDVVESLEAFWKHLGISRGGIRVVLCGCLDWVILKASSNLEDSVVSF